MIFSVDLFAKILCDQLQDVNGISSIGLVKTITILERIKDPRLYINPIACLLNSLTKYKASQKADSFYKEAIQAIFNPQTEDETEFVVSSRLVDNVKLDDIITLLALCQMIGQEYEKVMSTLKQVINKINLPQGLKGLADTGLVLGATERKFGNVIKGLN